ncbi:COMM domain-containing protein 8-like [Sycon ciliatum]|uniref:COMM domain-containing protein 8-like n=1 Tax=Sycon ciliatum TaxID=27933 RepID=UPI0020A85A23|eukprot:scpid85751/ scgid24442/ COMM domain-containing protein 8
MSTVASSHLHLLRRCSADNIQQFIHGVADDWCSRGSPRYQDYGKVWPIVEWKDAVEAGRQLVSVSIGKSKSKEEIVALLSEAGVEDDVAQAAASALEARRDDVLRALKANSATISRSHLKDFDWRVQLMMSSDKLASVRKPVVSVDLSLDGHSGPQKVALELDKEELKQMIQSLENANRVVQQLKS